MGRYIGKRKGMGKVFLIFYVKRQKKTVAGSKSIKIIMNSELPKRKGRLLKTVSLSAITNSHCVLFGRNSKHNGPLMIYVQMTRVGTANCAGHHQTIISLPDRKWFYDTLAPVFSVFRSPTILYWGQYFRQTFVDSIITEARCSSLTFFPFRYRRLRVHTYIHTRQ